MSIIIIIIIIIYNYEYVGRLKMSLQAKGFTKSSNSQNTDSHAAVKS
jgi:hypothetical protein